MMKDLHNVGVFGELERDIVFCTKVARKKGSHALTRTVTCTVHVDEVDHNLEKIARHGFPELPAE